MINNKYFSQYLQSIYQLEKMIESEMDKKASSVSNFKIKHLFASFKQTSIKHQKKFTEIKRIVE